MEGEKVNEKRESCPPPPSRACQPYLEKERPLPKSERVAAAGLLPRNERVAAAGEQRPRPKKPEYSRTCRRRQKGHCYIAVASLLARALNPPPSSRALSTAPPSRAQQSEERKAQSKGRPASQEGPLSCGRLARKAPSRAWRYHATLSSLGTRLE